MSVILWLHAAYSLEFLGLSRFIDIWFFSLLYQGSSVLVILQLISGISSAGKEISSLNATTGIQRELKKKGA